MSYAELERLIHKEPLEELYDVGQELGRLVDDHPLVLYCFTKFSLQRKVRHREEMHRKVYWRCIRGQVLEKATWREDL